MNDKENVSEAAEPPVEGWYGPPGSRRWHWIGTDGRSLCGKWFVLAWSSGLVNVSPGNPDGDCAACTAARVKAAAA